jgi:hypothetical protein
MRAPRGADSKREATTNPNPDFIQPTNFLVITYAICWKWRYVWAGEVEVRLDGGGGHNSGRIAVLKVGWLEKN